MWVYIERLVKRKSVLNLLRLAVVTCKASTSTIYASIYLIRGCPVWKLIKQIDNESCLAVVVAVVVICVVSCAHLEFLGVGNATLYPSRPSHPWAFSNISSPGLASHKDMGFRQV